MSARFQDPELFDDDERVRILQELFSDPPVTSEDYTEDDLPF